MLAVDEFTTESAPIERRAKLFQSEMATRFSVGLSIPSSSQAPLKTEVKAFCSERLQFAELRFSPHSTAAARVAGVNTPRLLITLQREGVAHVNQDGRESRIEAGDIFVINPSRPFSIQTGTIMTHSIYLPPSAVRELLPEIDSVTAMPIRSDQGPGRFFRATVDELFAIGSGLTPEVADSVADALPYLLATALKSLTASRDIDPSRHKLLHKQRIRQFARENLGDPGLSGEAIAAAVNLSSRYVYQLFSDEPQTLMRWVWSERLERCRRELAMAHLAKRSISEIAFAWGFNEMAHFSRAFRDAYGIAPRDYRKLHALPVMIEA
jgi:AraC-like DNA-binding protein